MKLNSTVAAWTSCLLGGTVLATAQPNILLINVDDLGYTDLGYTGTTFYETPNIDSWAAESTVFSHAYANAPNCAPSRASMLTGTYAPVHGVYSVGDSARGIAAERRLIPAPNATILDPDLITWASLLQDAGYATAIIGKYHLGVPGTSSGPQAHGFEVSIGATERGFPPSHFAPFGLPGLELAPTGEYLTDRLTTEAIEFMATRQDERPFALYLSYYAVHTPLQAPAELVQKYLNKRDDPEFPDGHLHDPVYAAMIESLDTNIGRLRTALVDLGLADDTIIIFTSDNGGVESVTPLHGLRGFKGYLYEGGIRVPLFIKDPRLPSPGAQVDVPVIHSDFFATLLEWAGASPHPGQPNHGQSLVPLLSNSGPFAERALFWHFPAYLERQPGIGDTSYTLEEQWRATPSSVIRFGDWKLIEFFEGERTELYDLADDPGEVLNLSSYLPGQASDLLTLLHQWQADLDAPVPSDPEPLYNPALPRNQFWTVDQAALATGTLQARLAATSAGHGDAWNRLQRPLDGLAEIRTSMRIVESGESWRNGGLLLRFSDGTLLRLSVRIGSSQLFAIVDGVVVDSVSVAGPLPLESDLAARLYLPTGDIAFRAGAHLWEFSLPGIAGTWLVDAGCSVENAMADFNVPEALELPNLPAELPPLMIGAAADQSLQVLYEWPAPSDPWQFAFQGSTDLDPAGWQDLQPLTDLLVDPATNLRSASFTIPASGRLFIRQRFEPKPPS